MTFNPDPNKQAYEVIFSRKLIRVCHSHLRFTNNNLSQASLQKHLGLTLDNRLTFDEHLTDVSNKKNHRIAMEITEYLTKASTSYNIQSFKLTSAFGKY